MIVTCPNCKKKFTIDDSLIPVEGRNLKCGTCDRVWFYKIEHKIAEPLKLEVNIEEKIEPSDDNVLISDTSETRKYPHGLFPDLVMFIILPFKLAGFV